MHAIHIHIRDLAYQICKNLVDLCQQLPQMRKTDNDAIERCEMGNDNDISENQMCQHIQEERFVFCERGDRIKNSAQIARDTTDLSVVNIKI